jgi:myo-inositol-1(or 4)-monophosphatase
LENNMTVDEKLIAFANRLADASGAVIRPYFRQRIEVVHKPGRAPFDPVTEADKGGERAIRAIIQRERPDDGILGEEYGETPGKNSLRWVLDPVDGTRAFITARHEWGSLIALEDNEVPVLGILDQPVLGERFIGVNGRSLLIEGEKRTPLKVRECAALKDAILCATDPSQYFSLDQQAGFARVKSQVRMTRYAGDCYLFAALALGFIDIIIEANFNRWDVAALIPLVEGAGGLITSWDGGDCRDGKTILACGDKRVHEEAIKLLKNAS